MMTLQSWLSSSSPLQTVREMGGGGGEYLEIQNHLQQPTWWEHGSLLGCWATRLVQGHLWKGKSRLPNVAALPARALFVLASFATQLTLSKTRKGEPKKLKDILLLLC
jgi:hypothetical protein